MSVKHNNESDMMFFNPEQIAQLLGCSVPVARQLWHRKDFPGLRIGKNFKVSKAAFELWCMDRRVEDV